MDARDLRIDVLAGSRVRVAHLPSGFVVEADDATLSQQENRDIALRLLEQRLAES